jgi:transcriptional regulator with XRE-family HTH domain
MTSFQLGIKPNRRAAGRFVDRVRSALQEALVTDKERIGITQSKIAAAIGVHRSVISRELNGRQDITLGRVAELAWAMGREIEFDLKVPAVEKGQNRPVFRLDRDIRSEVILDDDVPYRKDPVRDGAVKSDFDMVS